VSLSITGGNLPGGNLPAGSYRLMVSGLIHDLSGNSLDSNGDNVGGDDYLREFTLLPPTAHAGGPYTGAEGTSIALTGAASAGPITSYAWDLDNNGTFETPGANVVFAPHDNGVYTVRLQVTGALGSTVDTTTVTVNNVAPTAGIVAPTLIQHLQWQTFTLTATDPSAIDQSSAFTFAINWGDGSPIQTAVGPTGTQVRHLFATVGPRTISLTATDKDGALSNTITANVTVTAVQLRPNSLDPSRLDLVWGGTGGSDHVRFEQVTDTRIRVITLEENGVATNNVETFDGVSGIVQASGYVGDDVLDASGLTTTKAMLDGGYGNNTLYGGGAGDVLIGGANALSTRPSTNVIIAGNGDNTIYGNTVTAQKGSIGGNNIIVGGSGHDTIYGNFGTNPVNANNPTGNGGEGGQNLIVGGDGADTIYASQIADGAEGGHGSIVVSGSTSLSPASLQSVFSEWTSAHTIADKIANILGVGSASRLNGDSFLTPGGTLSNDAAIDHIFSDSNGQANWMLVTLAQDVSTRVKSQDVKTGVP
jgi:PKD repeat protein